MHLLLLLLALVAPAQRPADVVKWSASAPGKPVVAGSVARLSVVATVQPGWKLYAIDQPPAGPRPLAFGVAKGSAFVVVGSEIGAPAAKVQKQDANFSLDTRYYENEATFTIPVTIPRGTAPGAHVLPLEVTFQACGNELCLRPFTQKLPVQITVVQ